MRRESPRRGVALLAALIVLGVVGTLLVAGYYAERAAWERGAISARGAQLDAGTDGAVLDVIAAWDSAARFRQVIGSTIADSYTIEDGRALETIWITRLSGTAYWLTVRLADAADPSLAARAAAVVCVRAPAIPAPGGGLNFDDLGGMTAAELESRADLTIAAGSAIPAPTGNIVRATGPISLTGGAGGGLLIVEGSVEITGPVKFSGVILASGPVSVSSTGVVVTGSLLAGGGLGGKSLADLDLRFDSNVVAAVLWHAGRANLAAGRPWTPAP